MMVALFFNQVPQPTCAGHPDPDTCQLGTRLLLLDLRQDEGSARDESHVRLVAK